MLRVATLVRISIFGLVLFLHLAKSENYNVELVQVVFRHGDRTPRREELYPNDPYDFSIYEKYGSIGEAQLTNQGKLREYRIGEMLRKRYDKFLGNTYHNKDVYAVSTDVVRTKMSLQLVLAGLYPPPPHQKWKKDLAWMPIPYNYFTGRVDFLMGSIFYPPYKTEIEKVRKMPEVLAKIDAHKDTYKLLSGYTGLNVTRHTQAYEVYLLLTAQKAMKLKLPSWCTDEMYEKLQQIVMLEYEIGSFTPTLRRLNGGLLIKKFIENMNLDGKGQKRAEKIYLYSGHETNIAAVTKAFGFDEPKLPDFGSAILVEKLRGADNKIYVRTLYWTGVTEKLITYKLPNCGEICPIKDYLEFVKGSIPTDREVDSFWDSVTVDDIRTYYCQQYYNCLPEPVPW